MGSCRLLQLEVIRYILIASGVPTKCLASDLGSTFSRPIFLKKNHALDPSLLKELQDYVVEARWEAQRSLGMECLRRVGLSLKLVTLLCRSF